MLMLVILSFLVLLVTFLRQRISHVVIFCDCALLNVHVDLNLRRAEEFNPFDSPDLNARKPNVIPRFESGHIVENGHDANAFGKALLLTTQHEHPGHENENAHQDENTDNNGAFV